MDYSKLKGRIVEKVGSVRKLSELINLSERSLSLKLNNKLSFKQTEIVNICNVLEINSDDIGSYFFTKEVPFNGIN